MNATLRRALRPTLAAVALALGVGSAGGARAQLMFDVLPAPEIATPATLAPPSPPEQWLLVYTAPTSDNAVWIDPASIVVLGDRALRYTLVVVGSGGARNVTHEALRCDQPERLLLAIGRSDGSWSMQREPQWRRMTGSDTRNIHHEQVWTIVCQTGRVVGRTPERVAQVLREDRRATPR